MLFVPARLIDKLAQDYADDPARAWRERLCGGETPDAELVHWITPNAVRPSPAWFIAKLDKQLADIREAEAEADALEQGCFDVDKAHAVAATMRSLLADSMRALLDLAVSRPDLVQVYRRELASGSLEGRQKTGGPAS